MLSSHINKYISMATEQTPSTNDMRNALVCQTIPKSRMDFSACERKSAMLPTDAVIVRHTVLV